MGLASGEAPGAPAGGVPFWNRRRPRAARRCGGVVATHHCRPCLPPSLHATSNHAPPLLCSPPPPAPNNGGLRRGRSQLCKKKKSDIMSLAMMIIHHCDKHHQQQNSHLTGTVSGVFFWFFFALEGVALSLRARAGPSPRPHLDRRLRWPCPGDTPQPTRHPALGSFSAPPQPPPPPPSTYIPTGNQPCVAASTAPAAATAVRGRGRGAGCPMERPQVVVLDLDGLCWCVHALAAKSGEGGGKGGWWGGGRGGWAVGELVWVDGLVGPGRARCGVQVFVCESGTPALRSC